MQLRKVTLTVQGGKAYADSAMVVESPRRAVA